MSINMTLVATRRPTLTRRALRELVILSALAVGSVALAAASAMAGECPADKIVAGGQGQQPGATAPKGVSDRVLAQIDVSGAPVNAANRLFRMRELVVAPGGEVPWHMHDKRPALIYIVEGEITEYASNCLVPITHKAHEVAMESFGLSHWWKNNSKKAARLISADLLPVEADAKTM